MSALTQTEADDLLTMPKVKVDNRVWSMENARRVAIPLLSEKRHEAFFLDLRYSRMDLVRATLQNRSRDTIILARLDLGSSPHRNPDGGKIECPHIHYYKEGYRDDAWARPVGEEIGATLESALDWFFGHCHVVDRPRIEGGLLSCTKR